MNTRTRRYKTAAIILSMISILVSWGPLIGYIVIALNKDEATGAKAVLLSCVSVSVIISVVCVINKIAPRCRFLIILAGIAVVLDTIDSAIIILAVTQAMDELIICPLKNHVVDIYKINKEIDRRI